MSMICDPQTYQQVMDMNIALDTRSKLRHSYFIMKRYLRDVAEHLLVIGAERVDGERASSSTDVLPENPVDRQPLCVPSSDVGSSTEGLPDAFSVLTYCVPRSPGLDGPPGLSMPQTAMLEEAFVELWPVLDNPSAASDRAKDEQFNSDLSALCSAF
jgi:hypothetical protein